MNIQFWLCFMLLSFMGSAQRIDQKYPLMPTTDAGYARYDTFHIKGVVKEIYVCPPCPPGMICKPCIGNHILVDPIKPAGKELLRIFVEKPLEFTKEEIYVFLLQLKIKDHPDQGALLIKAEAVKTK